MGGTSEPESYKQAIKMTMDILDRPIAFHRCFAEVAGGALPALMLSQALYWQRRPGKDEGQGGWWWKTQEQWTEETGMSRTEIETARRKLVASGLLEHKKAGCPGRSFYRVNAEKVYLVLSAGSQTSLRETCKLDCGKPANKNAGFRQTKRTETIPEITPEKGKRRIRSAPPSDNETTHSLVTFYFTRFRETTGDNLYVGEGQLQTFFFKALGDLSPTEITSRIDNWFASKEQFIIDNNYSIKQFIEKFARLKKGPIHGKNSNNNYDHIPTG